MSATPTKAWMGRVASLGCMVCRMAGHPGTPAQLHHIRTGQGGAQRAPDELVIPLCPEHHTGDTGLHTNRELFALMWGTEVELLARTIREVCRQLSQEGKL